MALRMWASSAANALRISSTSMAPTYPLSRRFSTVLDGLKYASSHEWVKHEGSVATVGVTDHAQVIWDTLILKKTTIKSGRPEIICVTPVGMMNMQDHLGEVVFVELPEAGTPVTQGSSFGAVESVKATSDVNSPISGEVVEVNSKLTESPGLINSSPYEDGWMIKVKASSPAELEKLMDAKAYTKFCEEEDASH